MRGRVNAVNQVFVGASNELGEFRAGTMAALIGTVPAVVIGGVGAIAVAGLWAFLFPRCGRCAISTAATRAFNLSRATNCYIVNVTGAHPSAITP